MPDPVKLDQNVAQEIYDTLFAHRQDGLIGRTHFKPGEIDEAITWLGEVKEGREPSGSLTLGAWGAIDLCARHHDLQDIGRIVTGAGAAEQSAASFVSNARRFADNPTQPVRVHSMEEFGRWVRGWGGRAVVFETNPHVELEAQLRRAERLQSDLKRVLKRSLNISTVMGLGALVGGALGAITEITPTSERASEARRGILAFLQETGSRISRIEAFLTQIDGFESQGKSKALTFSLHDLRELTDLLGRQQKAMAALGIKPDLVEQLAEVLQQVRDFHAARLQLAMKASYDPQQGVRYVFYDSVRGTNAAVELTFDEHGLARISNLDSSKNLLTRILSISLNNGVVIHLNPGDTLSRGLEGQWLRSVRRAAGTVIAASHDLPDLKGLGSDGTHIIEITLSDSTGLNKSNIEDGMVLSAEFNVAIPGSAVPAFPEARVGAHSARADARTEEKVPEIQQRYAERIWKAYEKFREGQHSLDRKVSEEAFKARKEYGVAVKDYLILLGYNDRLEGSALVDRLRESHRIAGSTVEFSQERVLGAYERAMVPFPAVVGMIEPRAKNEKAVEPKSLKGARR